MQPAEADSDPFDRATSLEMMERDSVIALAHCRFVEAEAERLRVEAAGVCLNCEAPVPSGRYCDADCRDDHQLRARAQRRNGNPPPQESPDADS